MAAQTVLKLEDVPTGLALMNVVQQLSGAVFVSIAQNVFKTSLIHKLGDAVLHDRTRAEDTIKMGATDIRRLVSAQDLPLVLAVYSSALQLAFLVGLVAACVSSLGSCLLEWRSVKGVQGPT